MTISINQLISSTTDPETSTTVDCKLVGTIEGQFSLIDRDETEFSQERVVPVLLGGLLKSLQDAGLKPRGGGMFPYGGNAKISGRFRNEDKMEGRVCLVDYESIEVEVHRRDPVRLTKSVESSA